MIESFSTLLSTNTFLVPFIYTVSQKSSTVRDIRRIFRFKVMFNRAGPLQTKAHICSQVFFTF